MIVRAEFPRRKDHPPSSPSPCPPVPSPLPPFSSPPHHRHHQVDLFQQQGLSRQQGSIWQQQARGALIEPQDGALSTLAASFPSPSPSPTAPSKTTSSNRVGSRGGGPSKLAAMRDPPDRTKVVIRHLPPSLSESVFLEQIESRFSCLYNFFAYYPGKSSLKGSKYSRAYIEFRNPDDVFKFHDAFDGHVFVNEKGSQYKALVEYAPYQRVPKHIYKKDVRDSSILKDPEYLEFLEVLAKPVENLPSAEVQLERKEAERNSNIGAKEAIIVTPLMEFVRQRRALKPASQRQLASGKMSGRGLVSSSGTASNLLPRRVTERSRPNSVYVPSQVAIRPKDRATFPPHREESQRRDRETVLDKKRREASEFKGKHVLQQAGLPIIAASDNNVSQIVDVSTQVADTTSHLSIANDDSIDMDQDSLAGLAGKPFLNFGVTTDPSKDGRMGKMKVLLLKEKEREAGNGSGLRSTVLSDDSNGASRTRGLSSRGAAGAQSSSTSRHGRISPGRTTTSRQPSARGRSSRSSTSSSRDHSTLQQQSVQPLFQSEQAERDKRTQRRSILKAANNEFNSIAASESESGLQQSSVFPTRFTEEKSEAVYGDGSDRHDGRRVRNRDRPDRPVWTVRQRSDNPPSGSSSILSPSASSGSSLSLVAGTQKHARRERSSHGLRELDSILASDASKLKRSGGSSTYGGHEKQVWVAKSGSGT